MEIQFSRDLMRALKAAKCKSPMLSDTDAGDWHRDVETRALVDADFPIIRSILKRPDFYEDRHNRRILRCLDAEESLRSGDAKGKPVKSLEALPDMIRAMVVPSRHKWLFRDLDSIPSPVPFFMMRAQYHPPQKQRDSYTPACVTVTLAASARGDNEKATLRFDLEDIKGGKKTVLDLLAEKQAMLETPELVADYERSLAKYEKHAHETGEQFVARGIGFGGSAHWARDLTSFERDGVPAKVVMDDEEERASDSGYEATKYWAKDWSPEEDEEGEDSFKLPVHPIVRVFNLGTHEFIRTHIDNLEPYPYDAKIGQKLILRKDHKDLIDALTDSAIQKMSDIVAGKATGVIVLCSGKPGTGKTLTAEVYAEVARRPLYTVQCSQLGTDEESLEGELDTVLKRAARWRAILLIDEADVYIHERGESMQQNAIVGIFLRLLEYYAGILFLTTNRATIIDDAVLSRCTAHVHYDVPPDDLRPDVWRVLLAQYKVELSAKEVSACIAKFPRVSGRSVRQLIRLAKIMADRRKTRVTPALIEWAGQYQDFSEMDGLPPVEAPAPKPRAPRGEMVQ